jgi:soluble P-type ATPase
MRMMMMMVMMMMMMMMITIHFTTPPEKLLVTEKLKARESCVAVTGDGVSDSPALR